MMKTINRQPVTAAGLLFAEIDEHLLRDETPSVWLREAEMTAEFDAYPFSMLKKLEPTPQSPVHHPEGNVWNHTLLVVNEAARRKEESGNPRVLMWAALLHDIGKPATTKIRKGRITAYDHDKTGAKLTQEFLSALTDDRCFIDKVVNLVKYHMQVLYVMNNLPFKDIAGMKRDADIEEVALLGLCDRLGRDGASSRSEAVRREEEQARIFVEQCRQEQGRYYG